VNTQTLKAEVRKESGKGPARQLRMKGLIPAVFYGPGKEPTMLAVSPTEVTVALQGDYGRNQLLELSIGGKPELAIIRDLAVEPVTREIRHVDFYSVAKDRPIRTTIPVVTTGRAVGVQAGGVLHIIYRHLPVIAAPDKVPAKITLDITSLELHQSIKAKDIKLPDGVTAAIPPERPVVAVETKEKEKEEVVDPAAAAAAPGAAPAAGAAAAPAAAGAKAAAPAAGAKAAPAAKDAKKK
jgi:large subunit ribosomal protein L25